MSELLAIGVDGARGGWLAALAFGDGGGVERSELRLVPELATAARLAAEAGVILAADVPIGLQEHNGFRACELQARALLGPRRSSVFASPGRRFIGAVSYAEARRLVEELRAAAAMATGEQAAESGEGGSAGEAGRIQSLSAQTWGIVPKIREADDVATSFVGAGDWLWECHPELSFLAMRGGGAVTGGREMVEGDGSAGGRRGGDPEPLPLPPKSQAAGQAARLALIAERFPDALSRIAALPPGTQADPTDAADAYAVLWSALRIGRGEHVVLGDGRVDNKGVPMRMGF